MKKNIKSIISILIGMVLVSGISVYATLSYSSGDISYTKSGESTPITVESALNELYAIKKDYIKTSGIKKVTEKGDKIDISKYEYIDTSGMYTKDEYEVYGNEKYLDGTNSYANSVGFKCGTFVLDKVGTISISCGFKPKCIMITRVNKDGTSPNTYMFSYDEALSESLTFKHTINPHQVEEFTLGTVASNLQLSNVTNFGFEFYSNTTRGDVMYYSTFK